MKTRITAGLSAAAVLIWLVFWGPHELMATAVLMCAVIACLEYDRLFFPARDSMRQLRFVLMVSLTILGMRLPGFGWIVFWLCFVFMTAYRVVAANRDGDMPAAVRSMALEFLGYIYVVGLFGFMMPLVESWPGGRAYLFLLFCVVFGTDTGAYFAGMKFGKHKLAPMLSPKKSIEGAVGGVLFAMFMTGCWLYGFHRDQMWSEFGCRVLLFAPLGSVLAQLGDLFESLLKRSQSQKDSGSFLPGHGGLLDRVDGLLLVSPVFYYYLAYFLESR